jgi:hypothetical protein
VFAAAKHSTEPRSGAVCRHHVEEKQVQRYCKRAAQEAGIAKLVSPHPLLDLAERFLYDSPIGRGEIKP